MSSIWTGTSASVEPPWGVSSYKGSNGHIQAIGGTLYGLFPEAQSSYTSDFTGWVWESTDDGVNWTRINATSLHSYLGLSSGQSTMIVDGTDLVFVVRGNATIYAAKFSTSSDTWTANSSHSVTTSGSYSSYYGIDSDTDGTTMYVNHPFSTEKVMGTPYGRAAWVPLTISSLSWGSDTNWEEHGLQIDQTSGPIVVDANGDPHTIICDQANSNGVWEHFEDTGSIQGPHSMSTHDDNWSSPPILEIKTISSTETLILVGRDSVNTWHTVFFSTNNGATWSEQATLDDYTVDEPNDNQSFTVLMDSSDKLYFTWGAYTGSAPYVGAIWEWTRTSGGTWSDPAELLTNDYLPNRGANAAWSDESSGLYFYGTYAQTNDPDYYDMTYGIKLGGPLTLTKNHTTDMHLSLIGVVGDHYIPDGMPPPINLSMPSFPFTTLAVDGSNSKRLAARAWHTWDPEATSYAHYEELGPVWTFSSDIAAFDYDPPSGCVAVQLDDGSVYLARWDKNESQGYNDYYNEWSRDTSRSTVGPAVDFREIVTAPTTTPATFGVSVGHGFAVEQNNTDWEGAGFVAFTGEPVSGKEKIYYTLTVFDPRYYVWGSAASSSTAAQIDGMWGHPPQPVDALNTSYDEKLIGITYGDPVRYPTSHTNRTSMGAYIWYTKEEASNTFVYQARVHPFQSQEIWTDASSGNFSLKFPHPTQESNSNNIAYNDSGASVATAIGAMDEITTVTATGSGIQSDPWIVQVTLIDNPYGAGGFLPYTGGFFYEGDTNTLSGGSLRLSPATVVKHMEVSHQSIPKLQSPWTAQGYMMPSSWGWQGIGPFGARSNSTHSMLIKQTNGKLGIWVPTFTWNTDFGADDPDVRYDLFCEYAKDVSSGNVHLHEGYVAAAWFTSTKINYYDSTLGSVGEKGFTQYDFVVYVDATSQDLKRTTRARLGQRND